MTRSPWAPALVAALAGCGEAAPPRPARPAVPVVSAAKAPPIAAPRSCTRAPETCSRDGWCLENPSPTDARLHAVWGSHPGDVYAVGEEGTILHFDGRTWRAHTVEDRRFHGVWGSSTQNVFFLAMNGVLHFDGQLWTDMELPEGSYNAIWGSGPRDVWAGGEDTRTSEGVLAHHDGEKWTRVPWGIKGEIWSLWGTGPTDVYAGFDRGGIAHHDGKKWSVVRKAPGDDFAYPTYGLGGTGPADVFATDGLGAVVHFDGKTWTLQDLPVKSLVVDVQGTAPGEVHAVTSEGDILRYDGKKWAVATEKTPSNLDAVWVSGHEAVAVGWHGEIRRFDGKQWSAPPRVTRETLTRLWGSSPEDLYAAGGKTILHHDGCEWRILATTPETIGGLWGRATGDVLVVGSKGMIRHFDGKAWSDEPSGVNEDLSDIAGRGPDEVYAVGRAGTLLRRTGGTWTKIPAPGPADLVAVAVGPEGALVVMDRDANTSLSTRGGPWTPVLARRLYTPVLRPLGDDILLADASGRMARLHGGAWEPLGGSGVGGVNGPHDFWANTLDDITVVGGGGDLRHHDGHTWRIEATDQAASLRAIWGTANERVVVGDDGVILRKRHTPRKD